MGLGANHANQRPRGGSRLRDRLLDTDRNKSHGVKAPIRGSQQTADSRQQTDSLEAKETGQYYSPRPGDQGNQTMVWDESRDKSKGIAE